MMLVIGNTYAPTLSIIFLSFYSLLYGIERFTESLFVSSHDFPQSDPWFKHIVEFFTIFKRHSVIGGRFITQADESGLTGIFCGGRGILSKSHLMLI
jgi:hypothetical protein